MRTRMRNGKTGMRHWIEKEDETMPIERLASGKARRGRMGLPTRLDSRVASVQNGTQKCSSSARQAPSAPCAVFVGETRGQYTRTTHDSRGRHTDSQTSSLIASAPRHDAHRCR